MGSTGILAVFLPLLISAFIISSVNTHPPQRRSLSNRFLQTWQLLTARNQEVDDVNDLLTSFDGLIQQKELQTESNNDNKFMETNQYFYPSVSNVQDQYFDDLTTDEQFVTGSDLSNERSISYEDEDLSANLDQESRVLSVLDEIFSQEREMRSLDGNQEMTREESDEADVETRWTQQIDRESRSQNSYHCNYTAMKEFCAPSRYHQSLWRIKSQLSYLLTELNLIIRNKSLEALGSFDEHENCQGKGDIYCRVKNKPCFANLTQKLGDSLNISTPLSLSDPKVHQHLFHLVCHLNHSIDALRNKNTDPSYIRRLHNILNHRDIYVTSIMCHLQQHYFRDRLEDLGNLDLEGSHCTFGDTPGYQEQLMLNRHQFKHLETVLKKVKKAILALEASV